MLKLRNPNLVLSIIMLIIGLLLCLFHIVNRNWGMAIVTGVGIAILLLGSMQAGFQKYILGRKLNHRHILYLALFVIYGSVWLYLLRELTATAQIGKTSEPFYVITLALVLVGYRTLASLFAITKWGYRILITQIPGWEQMLVAFHDAVAMGAFAVVWGTFLAHLVQPEIFTLRFDPLYNTSLLFASALYFVTMQMMWFQRWNDWLSNNKIWVRLARVFAPLVLFATTIIIVHHYSILSDLRTADLLGTLQLNRTLLALSPVIWLMIFFVVALVYSGSNGLRNRLLPNGLIERLPARLHRWLSTISDMDILLIAGFFSLFVSALIWLSETQSASIVDVAQTSILLQDSFIGGAEQLYSLLFALPFYLMALFVLLLYAYVVSQPELSSIQRDDLMNNSPVGLLIVLIITLYLCAIPFSQVLATGELPPLGSVLIFDIFFPLMILYGHYWLLVRLPYARGQAGWRKIESARLDELLQNADHKRNDVINQINATDIEWLNTSAAVENDQKRIALLYQFISLNGQRDQINLERLDIVDQKQKLAEVSEAPVSVTVAKLPTRIVTFGIPILLAFKFYEWAILNDQLREIATNPSITLSEFLGQIVELIF